MRWYHIVFLVLMTISFSSCELDCDRSTAPEPTDIPRARLIYPFKNSGDHSRSPFFIWDGHVEEGDFTFTVTVEEELGPAEWMFFAGPDTTMQFPDTLESNTGYTWRVRTESSDETLSQSTSYAYFRTGDTFNNPPSIVTFTSPWDNTTTATDIPVDAVLTWHCFDPDGDIITYDIYYKREQDTDSVHVSGITEMEFSTPLDADTFYKFYVKPYDEHGATTGKRGIQFYTVSTPPPFDPFPADGAGDLPTDVTLSWSCEDPDGDALTYDVEMGRYGGTMSLVGSDIAQDELPVAGLSEGVTYEWKVTAEDDDGHRTEGPVWSFTTIGDPGDIFADLTLNRRQTRSGIEITVIDNIWATFREGYTPPYSGIALRPDTVICGDFGLVWDNYRRRFYYENSYTLTFLVPGTGYEFTVAEGGGVPALTESIIFPMCAPMITSPESFQSVPMSGFEVTWSGYDAFPDCDRQVTLEIHELGGIPTGVSVTTDNDGSYTFSAGELSAIDPSIIDFEIVLILENVINIDSPGYDPRSWVRARNVSAVTVYSD